MFAVQYLYVYYHRTLVQSLSLELLPVAAGNFAILAALAAMLYLTAAPPSTLIQVLRCTGSSMVARSFGVIS